MTPGVTFAIPVLLIGLLAAGIPFILHLISSVNAPQVPFPTLRFLRSSMEKTARRRRIQHWLLLALRSALLGILALAVAQPISRATGGWLGGERTAAVIVLDNSLSMSASDGESTPLARARAGATDLLGGTQRPTLAAVLTTTGRTSGALRLSGEMDTLRQELSDARVGYGPSALGRRVAQAIDLLGEEPTATRRAVYVFTDLQRTGMQELLDLRELADAADVHLMLVNAARGPADNVAITDLEVRGRRVVNGVVEFAATLVNSSPQPRTVSVSLHVDGGTVRTAPQQVRLGPAGGPGAATVVRLYHQFPRGGTVWGEVRLSVEDAVAGDNVRRFSLVVAEQVNALIVHGTAESWQDPSHAVATALDPWEASGAWPIALRTVSSDRFTAADLRGVDALYLCEPSELSPAQVEAIAAFCRAGGTAMLFLGPDSRPDHYNELWHDRLGLLPGRLSAAEGELGPHARAMRLAYVDDSHPYLAGLYEHRASYLTGIVQRRFRVHLAPDARVLLGLEGGSPLLVERRLGGGGRVLLFATTSSLSWNNVPIQPIFLPLVVRSAVLAQMDPAGDQAFVAGAAVAIRPHASGAQARSVSVIPPGSDARVVTLPLEGASGAAAARFLDAGLPGAYRWQVEGTPPGEAGTWGVFVVNPHGPESLMERLGAQEVAASMTRRGLERVYVGASLDEVHALAADDATGRNWWDVLLAMVAVLLVVEAVVSNRRSPGFVQPEPLTRAA